MTVLVIYRGDEDHLLPPSDEITYSYSIGTGRILGRKTTNLNDASLLNDIAISLRDSYTKWVYSLNEVFTKNRFTYGDLSLFFLTDLSNKRNELFDTYETLSNITFLKKTLGSKTIHSIYLIGVDKSFVNAIRSIFKESNIIISKKKSKRISLTRRILADVKYFFQIMLILVINAVLFSSKRVIDTSKKKYFFSFYPQTFDEQNTDSRYGSLVSDEDRYLVTMVADGMHQQISPFEYYRLSKHILDSKMVVIDRYLRMRHVVRGICCLLKFYRLLLGERKSVYQFGGIDLTMYIRQEIVWSASRVSRLLVMAESLKIALSKVCIAELVYITFEYPFGRMISYVVGKYWPDILRTGFNHGDYSWRFINYFLAPGEARVKPPYLDHCPVPDRVLAEDSLCAKIYEYNGYKSIELMPRVYRLQYLEGIQTKKKKNLVLIAAGLHDGEALVKSLLGTIENTPTVKYLLKPHPRGDNRYKKRYRHIANLEITSLPIERVLSVVGRVYVTYSGVGVEAWALGIPVTLVNIPGKVSWSKLLDYQALGDSFEGNNRSLCFLE